MDGLIYDIFRDGKSRLSFVSTVKVSSQAFQSMLRQLRLMTFLLLVFGMYSTTVSAGEWVIKEEWLSPYSWYEIFGHMESIGS